MSKDELQERCSDGAAGREGQVPPDPAWEPLEIWVWTKLQAGAVADIDEFIDKQGPLPPADPPKPEAWQDGRRRLTPRFLEDLLLREPYRSGLHRKGVRIEGAWFDREIDLEWSEITRQIWLERCRFEQPVKLSGLHTPRSMSFDGSTFAFELELWLARIGAQLTAVVATFENSVFLNGAHVGGYVSLIGANVVDTLDLNSAEIGQNLLLHSDRRRSGHRAKFEDIDLRGAKIGGQANLIGAKVAGTLNLDSSDIGQSLFMASDRSLSDHRAEFEDVVLRGAKIGGQVALIGAKVAGTLDLDSSDIGQSLLMRSDRSVSEHQAEFGGAVNLVFAKIDGNLDLGGAVLSGLDLTGTKIDGEFRLASPSPRWQGRKGLVLRNASADAIQDTDKLGVWPSALDLDGFIYRRFGGLGADAEADVARRGSGWFVEWLARDEPHTPQPYEQCARVLREMGHPDMANDVLYAGREREREQAWREGNNPRGAGLTLLKWLVGYGYGYRLLVRPLGWAVAIILFGAFLPDAVGLLPTDLQPEPSSWCAKAASGTCLTDHAPGWRLLFSLDMLLPIVELSREHTVLQAGLDGVTYGWFVLQRLFGWVLALFLIAGLTGLTK